MSSVLNDMIYLKLFKWIMNGIMIRFIFLLTAFYLTNLNAQSMVKANKSNGPENASISNRKLLPLPVGEGNDGIGTSMDVDSEKTIVGATGMQGTGAAIIYELNDNSWVKAHVLKPTNLRDVDDFGADVSIHGDQAIVGCGAPIGCAFVYVFKGGNWNLDEIFVPQFDFIDNSFGNKVSIHENRIAISSEDNAEVYLYEKNDDEWSLIHTFTPPLGYSDQSFGFDLKLLNSRMIIGQMSGIGTAHVFDLIEEEWQVFSIDNPGKQFNTNFGATVNAFGDELVVGAGRELRGGAVYLFGLVDGAWEEVEYFKPDDIDAGEFFGTAIDMSSSRILIGAYQDNAIETLMGAAYLYEKVNDKWSFSEKITPTDESSNKLFGYSVGVSDESLVVGALGEKATYFYNENNDTWTENKEIVNPGSTRASFGEFVKYFGDMALVSAPIQKSVYLFELNDNVWSYVRTFEAPKPSEYGSFGFAIDMNGEFVVIGDRFAQDNGIVHIYKKNLNGSYSKTSLSATDGEVGDYFGWSVKLQDRRLFIGAPGHEEFQQFSGAVYVYEFNVTQNQWNFDIKLTNDEYVQSHFFGGSMSSSENKVMIGADYGTSSVIIFSFDGVDWQLEKKLGFNNGLSGTPYRNSNSIRLNGNMAVIGVYDGGINSEFNGNVNIFKYDGEDWSFEAELSPAEGTLNNDFGRSLDATEDVIVVGAINDDDLGRNAGAVYSFVQENGDWTQKFKFKGFDTYSYDNFGYSLKLQNDHILVGAPGDDDYGINSGSVYLISILDGIFEDGFEENIK